MSVTTRQERERFHYNRLAERVDDASLVMPEWNIRRYDRPPEDTVYSLEYAFHLLGDLRGRTVVDLGCGDGLNTVILAALGARVLSVDISDKSLEVTGKRAQANGVARNVTLLHSDAASIPVGDGEADRVLCAAILHHVDPIATARQIRRVLAPEGVAVFEEPLAGPPIVQKFKSALPKNPYNTDDERPLTLEEVDAVSRAVGVSGRRRKFGITTRLFCRLGIKSGMRLSREIDAALIRHSSFARACASPMVWEARKV